MSQTDLTPLANLDGEDGAEQLDRVLGRGLPAPAQDPKGEPWRYRGRRVVVWRGLRNGRRGVVVEARPQKARVVFDGEHGPTTVPWSVLEDEAAHDAARRPRERHELPPFCWDPSRPLVVSTLYLESYEP